MAVEHTELKMNMPFMECLKCRVLDVYHGDILRDTCAQCRVERANAAADKPKCSGCILHIANGGRLKSDHACNACYTA